MNKKGNLYFGFFVGFMIFAVGILAIPFITDDITTTRIALDCGNSSISSGTKMLCLAVDPIIPYLIWFAVSQFIGYIIGRNK